MVSGCAFLRSQLITEFELEAFFLVSLDICTILTATNTEIVDIYVFYFHSNELFNISEFNYYFCFFFFLGNFRHTTKKRKKKQNFLCFFFLLLSTQWIAGGAAATRLTDDGFSTESTVRTSQQHLLRLARRYDFSCVLVCVKRRLGFGCVATRTSVGSIRCASMRGNHAYNHTRLIYLAANCEHIDGR